MKIFLKSNHIKTGIHRFLESMTILDGDALILCDNIEDIKFYEEESGVFGGFLPEDIIGLKNIKNKYYVFCSPLGQADMSGWDFYSPEIRILINCCTFIRQGVLKNCITQSKSLSSRFGFIYIPPFKINMPNIDIVENRKNYGFLGNNTRKHKNVPNQLAAISMLKPKEQIVVSNAELYKYYGLLFNCEFIDKDLSEDIDYYSEIATHRLCFQCSHSEAFDYQAFEYMLCGVPTLVSPCIDWLGNKIGKYLMVNNIDSIMDIILKAQSLLSDEKLYNEMSKQVKERAFELNEKNKEKLSCIMENFK